MKSRPVFGLLLVILAFYAIYLYDTGRWSLIRAAIVSPPGTPLPGGGAPLTNQAGGGSVLPPGNHPLPPMPSGSLPPALPSSASIPMTGPASWLSPGQALIQSIWPTTAPTPPPNTNPVLGATPGAMPGYTPGIMGATWA